MSVHDEPVDSLRQRIERLVFLAESSSGKTTMLVDLKAALDLPDFSADQSARFGRVLDGLRFSAGLHRNGSDVNRVNPLAFWLENFSEVMAKSIDLQMANTNDAMRRSVKAVQDKNDILERYDELVAQRDAVRAFFGTRGDDDE